MVTTRTVARSAWPNSEAKNTADALLAGIRAALAVGSVDPEVVVIEARKAAERAVAPVVPIGALSRYDRPKPTLNGYDTLLEASS